MCPTSKASALCSLGQPHECCFLSRFSVSSYGCIYMCDPSHKPFHMPLFASITSLLHHIQQNIASLSHTFNFHHLQLRKAHYTSCKESILNVPGLVASAYATIWFESIISFIFSHEISLHLHHQKSCTLLRTLLIQITILYPSNVPSLGCQLYFIHEPFRPKIDYSAGTQFEGKSSQPLHHCLHLTTAAVNDPVYFNESITSSLPYQLQGQIMEHSCNQVCRLFTPNHF